MSSRWRRSSAFPTARSTPTPRASSSRASRRSFATRCIGEGVASVTNPLAVTQAYAARFAALGGVVMHGRCALASSRRRTLADRHCRRTASMPTRRWWRSGHSRLICLHPLGIKLPLGIKRGYHRHFRPSGNAALDAPGGRHRDRLLPRAHGAGNPAYDRGRVRRPRRAADAGAVRPTAAGSAGLVPARRSGRGNALDGQPSLFSGFTAGDRARPRTAPAVARLWPRPLGI